MVGQRCHRGGSRQRDGILRRQRVRIEVTAEGGLLAERPVAHLAAVRLDASVGAFVVDLEALPDERFVAVAAFVRFDSWKQYSELLARN